VCGRVRGVWGIFLLGKTTRFAQTSFSLPEKYPIPPYRRAAQEYQGQKESKATSGLTRALHSIDAFPSYAQKQMQLFSDYPPMPVGAGWLLDFLPEKDV